MRSALRLLTQTAPSFVALLAILSAATAFAELKLPAMFTSGAVLQQGMPVPVWGWADPGAEVKVTEEENGTLALSGGVKGKYDTTNGLDLDATIDKTCRDGGGGHARPRDGQAGAGRPQRDAVCRGVARSSSRWTAARPAEPTMCC